MVIKNDVSSFWLDIDEYASSDFTMKLVILQRTINDFVHILLGYEIPCHYAAKTGTSKTTGDNIIISAEVDNVDIVVGLSLHEAAHIKNTDFNSYEKSPNFIVEKKRFIDSTPRSLIPTIKSNDYSPAVLFQNFVHLFNNFIEDFRIDLITIKQSPGWKGYVDALYQKYFENENISELIESKFYRDETWQSYEFRILNLFHPSSDLTILKGLREINNIIDIEHINRLNSTSNSLDVAIQIFKIVEKYCGPPKELPSIPIPEGKLKAVNEQKNFTNNIISKKKLNVQTLANVDSLVNISYRNEKIHLSDDSDTIPVVKVMIIDDINSVFISTDPFKIFKSPFTKKTPVNQMQLFISSAIATGEKLASKLVIRNSIKDDIYSYKKQGKIDKRLLYSASYNSKIFYEHYPEEFNDVYLHFSLDASGSMSGLPWDKTIKTVLAICYACTKISGIHCVVDFRLTSCQTDIFPIVLIAYDSSKNNLYSFIDVIKAIQPHSGTPEGLCYAAILNHIEEKTDKKDSYFINFSDGLPEFPGYNNKIAINHTRSQVEKIRGKGVKVLSYFISEINLPKEAEENFKYMYGKDAVVCDIEKLNDLALSLNKLFTKGL